MSADSGGRAPGAGASLRLLRGVRRGLTAGGKRRRRQTLQAWRARRSVEAAPASVEAEPTIRVRPRRRAPTPGLPSVIGRARHRVRGRAALPAIVLGLLVVATALYLWRSPEFRVRGAQVSGNRRVPADIIYRVGMLDGQWAFTVDRRGAERRIELLDDVRQARVRLTWPAHLAIQVVETPVVLLWLGPSAPLAVDDTGRAIDIPGDATGLPSVRDEAGLLSAPGDRLPEGLLQAGAAYAARFGTLVYRRADGFVAVVADGWEVHLGSDPSRIETQLLTLDALTRHLSGTGATVAFVDLRYPDRPYYRLRGGAN